MFEFLNQNIQWIDYKIHFSNYKKALCEALQKANKSIRMTTYLTAFSFKKAGNPVNDIMKIIEQKKRKGVEIKFIIDGPKKGAANFKPALFFSKYLEGNGYKYAIQKGKPTLHMKITIIDLEKIFIGSHNLTRSSIQNPLDCTVQIKSMALGVLLADKFDLLFESLKNGKS